MISDCCDFATPISRASVNLKARLRAGMMLPNCYRRTQSPGENDDEASALLAGHPEKRPARLGRLNDGYRSRTAAASDPHSGIAADPDYGRHARSPRQAEALATTG